MIVFGAFFVFAGLSSFFLFSKLSLFLRRADRSACCASFCRMNNSDVLQRLIHDADASRCVWGLRTIA